MLAVDASLRGLNSVLGRQLHFRRGSHLNVLIHIICKLLIFDLKRIAQLLRQIELLFPVTFHPKLVKCLFFFLPLFEFQLRVEAIFGFEASLIFQIELAHGLLLDEGGAG